MVTRSALLVTAALAVASTSAAAASPSLRVVDREPLVARGVGFRPGEAVVLTAAIPRWRQVRHVRASRVGRLLVRFAVPAGRCGDLVKITAVGSRGSRARTATVLRPCVPVPIDP